MDWYRAQIKEHGIVDATHLLWRVGWSRIGVNLANKLLPGKLACPCCGWQGRRFYDFIELGYTVPNTACPQCDSHARHRAFYLWLSREYPLQNRTGIALVFAAEGALAALWKSTDTLQVYRVDIEAVRGRELLSDLTHLAIATDAVDLVWCHHVLEHIEDDRAAIGELFRVLRPVHGELIVSVPMIPGSTTEEYGFADPRQTGKFGAFMATTSRIALPKVGSPSELLTTILPRMILSVTGSPQSTSTFVPSQARLSEPASI